MRVGSQHDASIAFTGEGDLMFLYRRLDHPPHWCVREWKVSPAVQTLATRYTECAVAAAFWSKYFSK
jgi:hypothetical protein